jgi:hypothetical protein
VSIELCLPQNQAELEGAHCLLGVGDPPVVPEVFPGQFFDEHFWWAAGGILTPASGGKAGLVLALEAAFAADVVPGGQMVFTRIRVRLTSIPVTGTYRFIHPYGEESIEAEAGAARGIFFTDDVGINCAPGQFDCAMQGRVGPFLMASNTPGGPELPAIPGPVAGKLYIADPARLGPVTGSTLPDFIASDGLPHNHNVFRIEGPPGSGLGGPGIDFIETTDFSLNGRLFTGQIPSLVTTDRASYGRSATEQKVDVFATAFPTAAARAPAGVRPAGVAPVMSFFSGPCGTTVDAAGNVTGYVQPTGLVEALMAAQGTARWGQFQPALGTPIPDSVCVKDNSAVDAQGLQVPSFHQMPVNDAVNITQALFDPVAQTLTVQATSSEQVEPPILTLTSANQPLVNGTVTVTGVTAPPPKVEVLSSKRGSDIEITSTGLASAGTAAVVAGNDTAITLEDTAVLIPVIAGDTLNGVQIDPAATPVTLAIIANGSKGVAVANSATGAVTYTPGANKNGADSFTYTVTAGGVTSNIATVAVNITPVNDAPVANNDTAAGAINTPLVISVLANDVDVDGDVLTIASVTAPTGPAGSTSSATANANGTVTFNGSAAGNYTFTYSMTDGTVVSNTATVTVNVASPETVNVTTGDYIVSKTRWKVTGSTSIGTAHSMTLKLTGVVGTAPCNADGRVLGTTNSAGTGFTFDFVATGPLDPRTTNCNRIKVESALGGVSPNFTFRLK